MKFCNNCGNQLTHDMKFCEKCGAMNMNYGTQKSRKGFKISGIVCLVLAIIYAIMSITVNRSLLSMVVFMSILGAMFLILSGTPKGQKYLGKVNAGNKGIRKSVFVISCIFVAFVGFGIITSIIPAESNNLQGEESKRGSKEIKTQEILDITRFANITSAELAAILGEPSYVESAMYSGIISIPCEYYSYSTVDKLSDVQFLLINDRVIQMLSYTELPYPGGSNDLASVGISNPTGSSKITDTEATVRYRCPIDTVDDVWFGLIDSEKEKFGFLKITYDLCYSEEWYMPMSTSEQAKYKTNTQLAVESILKSPKSADFPLFDWSYGKNPFYIVVQSYVDAENSFGANIRSKFTFIYSATSGELVYAIFDDEEMYNVGYVPYAELIEQLVYAE